MISIGEKREYQQKYSTNPIVLEEVFLDSDLEKVDKMIEKHGQEIPAPIDHAPYRSGKTLMIEYNDETAWIYGWMHHVVNDLNEKYYGFDAADWIEPLFYHEYAEGDACDLHMDLDGADKFADRKICITISLSASEDYRGGNMQIYTNMNFYTVGRVKGTITVFPSYLPYHIERVSQGKRRDLCFWVGGNAFK